MRDLRPDPPLHELPAEEMPDDADSGLLPEDILPADVLPLRVRPAVEVGGWQRTIAGDLPAWDLVPPDSALHLHRRRGLS